MNKVMSDSDEMQELFKSLSINYIKKSVHMVDLSRSRFLEESAYYKNNRKEFAHLEDRYGGELEKGRVASSSVRFLGETMGRGLFAETDLDKDDFVGEYCGVVGRASPCRPVKDKLGGYATDYAWTYPVKQGFHALEINARVNGNELRFVNHSFDPNCHMEHTLHKGRWALFLRTLRKIKKDEQFTVDYGEEYWSGGHRELILI